MANIGDKSICISCLNPIEAIKQGEYIIWDHIGASYRHMARPQAYKTADINTAKMFVSALKNTAKSMAEWISFVKEKSEQFSIPFSYEVTMLAYDSKLDPAIIKQMVYNPGGFALETFEIDYAEIACQKEQFDPDTFIRNLPAPRLMDNLTVYTERVTKGLTDTQKRQVNRKIYIFSWNNRIMFFLPISQKRCSL